MSDNSYKDDLKIDTLALDEELKWQPTLYMKWADLFAESSYRLDRQKEKVEITFAQCYEIVSISPEAYDIRRITEASLKSAIVQMPVYRAELKKLHRLKKETSVLSSAKDAMRQKKESLEGLIKLHISGYFAEPSLDPESRKVFEEMADLRETEKLKKSKRFKKLKRK